MVPVRRGGAGRRAPAPAAAPRPPGARRLVRGGGVAGDRTRPDALRIAAAGVAPVLGMGIYLSFSRGALAALAAGLVVLTVLAPTWPQLRSTLIAAAGGVVAAFTAS